MYRSVALGLVLLAEFGPQQKLNEEPWSKVYLKSAWTASHALENLAVTPTSIEIGVPVAQWLEHCVSSAKVVGSIPREHMYWQYKCIDWMHCKSLWIKASAKCINEKGLYSNLLLLLHLSHVQRATHSSRLLLEALNVYQLVVRPQWQNPDVTNHLWAG